ncbi:TPA: hypothetical protein JGU28_004518 [Salmonella enterica]|nr:hypothetical protein [Salmonella enterica]
MQQKPINSCDSELEHNVCLAEFQAYIIDELITEYQKTVTFWLADCGYDEFTVKKALWPQVMAFDRQLYIAPLVDFARKVVGSHF